MLVAGLADHAQAVEDLDGGEGHAAEALAIAAPRPSACTAPPRLVHRHAQLVPEGLDPEQSRADLSVTDRA